MEKYYINKNKIESITLSFETVNKNYVWIEGKWKNYLFGLIKKWKCAGFYVSDWDGDWYIIDVDYLIKRGYKIVNNKVYMKAKIIINTIEKRYEVEFESDKEMEDYVDNFIKEHELDKKLIKID